MVFEEAESFIREELGALLDDIGGPLDLIIDNSLISMLNKIAGFSFLKVWFHIQCAQHLFLTTKGAWSREDLQTWSRTGRWS